MKRKTNKGKNAKRLGWVAGLLLLLYGLWAILPYAFPPDSDQEKISSMLKMPIERVGQEEGLILESGEEALWGRLQLIAQAQSHIRLSSYLYACDDSGRLIGGALLAAAQRGVKVEILVDGLIGAVNFQGEELPKVLGSHENIEIRYYNPLNLLHPAAINARLHDKYLIADEQMLILGGRNISDEFLTPQDHPAYNGDRDVMLRVLSPGPDTGVSQTAKYFDELWNSAYVSTRFEEGEMVDAALERERMAALLADAKEEAAAWFAQAEFMPVERAVLLTNPQHNGVKEPWLFDALIQLMLEAEERIILQSPYFVLNGHMEEGIRAVADASSLTLMTNSMASGNNIMASADYLWQKGRVREIGGTLYETQLPYSTHTKSLLIDQDLSVFGSFNFDARSAYIDTEAMMAVYSEEINACLASHMEEIQRQSLQVMQEGYAQREDVAPASMEFGKKAIIYLLSPFLSLVRFLL